MPDRWDIFCRVVDNFGDAAVCWRLGTLLAHEHGLDVRLWIDDLQTLRRLQPALADVPRQRIDRVEVVKWHDRGDFDAAAEVNVVIEAFGCGLPEAYVEALARSAKRPLWIVLEYLSAEPWVREHHGLPSPHPRWPIERYFFFPGFVEGTGGLLRERDLFARREAFDDAQRSAFWRSLGFEPPASGADVVSLFGYERAPLIGLLEHWAQSPRQTVAAIPDGALVPAALSHFGLEQTPAGRVMRRDALEVRILPFVPQARYDALLWSCDVNFVRGEESFVRAQWAATPFVWHIYPQQDEVHAAKLQAFLDLYCDALDPDAARALRNLTAAWNGLPGAADPAAAWEALVEHRERLRAHAGRWAQRLAAVGELAENLASFCRGKLK